MSITSAETALSWAGLGLWRVFSGRCRSGSGSLSEDGNFFAQSHLQQFDFKQATAHSSVYSIWINFSRQAYHSEDVFAAPFGIDAPSLLLVSQLYPLPLDPQRTH